MLTTYPLSSFVLKRAISTVIWKLKNMKIACVVYDVRILLLCKIQHYRSSNINICSNETFTACCLLQFVIQSWICSKIMCSTFLQYIYRCFIVNMNSCFIYTYCNKLSFYLIKFKFWEYFPLKEVRLVGILIKYEHVVFYHKTSIHCKLILSLRRPFQS